MPARLLQHLSAVFFLALLAAAPLQAQQRPMTFTDVMQFRDVEHPVISDNGAWIAFTAEPDRGDAEAVVRATEGDTRYVVPRGSHVQLTPTGDYAAMRLNPSLADQERAEERDEKEKPKPGMVLLETATGDTVQVPRVDRFAFSHDGAWLAYLHSEDESEEHDTTVADTSAASEEAQQEEKRSEGTPLVLRRLATGDTLVVPHVTAFAFDEMGRHLAYAVAAPDSLRDGLYVRDLTAGAPAEAALDQRPHGFYSHLTWREDTAELAFLAAEEDTSGEAGDATLWLWDGDGPPTAAAEEDDLPDDWTLPAEHNELTWTDDGARLFFGLRPEDEEDDDEAESDTAAFDPYDVEALLDERTVDVWHWDDPLIQTNQKERWEEEQKRTYQAVYHRASDRIVPLGDEEVDAVGTPDNPRVVLGTSDEPYLDLRTWEGFFYDLYAIDLDSGAQTKIAEKLSSSGRSLSPDGRYAAFYDDGHWHLYDVEAQATRPLTSGLDVPFANEDHDYPDEPSGYGVAGWVGDDAVLIYDKYDIWHFPVEEGDGAPFRLTEGEGRTEKRIYRLVYTDDEDEDERHHFEPGEPLLVEGYHDRLKTDGFYRAHAGERGLAPLMVEDKRFSFVAKADSAEQLLFTREAYDEFPDLWIANPDFGSPEKLTDVNPQMDEIAWGDAELIEWNSLDGTPLQGVVIKPENYDPNRRYPVVVYFYRFFSQRLHEFNQPAVNHRPVFPLYASNDYVIFLPDVRFEVGQPGFSATKSVVPGVQKLIDEGIADPDAIGLHGHSWSGYQTAFIVTQTDLFKAAIAGAPVSNMTSAYSGIRWGSGLARQFQYEMGQSRIGGSLWEARERYIENSPVFFADQVNTPLLIIFGDEDGAVPWEQGIELYLALRRLDKPAWFLQYRGEDHHPAAYPNKLDWAMKMKEFFDHFLKGAPAPAWIEEGVPYAGERTTP